MELLSTWDLQYSYPQDGSLTLRYPNLSLHSGSSTGVIGPSGCGKSTLLNLISGLLHSEKGEVKALGKSLSSISAAKMDVWRAHNFGFIFQVPEFLESLTAIENLQFTSGLANGATYSESELLEKLDLQGQRNSYPAKMSQGERQRLAIARALIHKPRLILADEPSSALDDRRTEEVMGFLQTFLAEQDAALLLVSHDQRVKIHLDTIIHLEPRP